MVGGRDYGDTQFNRAIQARRQPGSCFKPFVYLAGLENGLTLATPLMDEPLERTSGGRTWRPSNHDGRFRGRVSARQALEESLNIPTVLAAEMAGMDRVIEAARRCGITSELRRYPSTALGSQEVTPLELATAYGTLAAAGVRATPRVIEEVRNREGERIERRPVERIRAVDPRTAYLVNDALRGVMTRGTASLARAYGYTGDAAGKTGTTDGNRDAWFVGYTPDLLALVWVGYDDNTRTGLGGASAALPIWVDIMETAASRGDSRPFRIPEGITRHRVDPASGMLAVRGCPERVDEWFARGAEPSEECPLHRKKGIRNWFRRMFGRDR
jgi:penicillin-binding protein 1B